MFDGFNWCLIHSKKEKEKKKIDADNVVTYSLVLYEQGIGR
jgi:hypothetical protein